MLAATCRRTCPCTRVVPHFAASHTTRTSSRRNGCWKRKRQPELHVPWLVPLLSTILTVCLLLSSRHAVSLSCGRRRPRLIRAAHRPSAPWWPRLSCAMAFWGRQFEGNVSCSVPCFFTPREAGADVGIYHLRYRSSQGYRSPSSSRWSRPLLSLRGPPDRLRRDHDVQTVKPVLDTVLQTVSTATWEGGAPRRTVHRRPPQCLSPTASVGGCAW